MEHEFEKILACPVCCEKSHTKHVEGKDHNVSGRIFTIVECRRCGFRFTNPRPKEKYIYKYYQSKNYISHSSTKKGLINKVYHLVRFYQFYKKKKVIKISSNIKKGRILDIGCGKGFFLQDLKNYNDTFEVYGVDISKYAIKNAHSEIKPFIFHSNSNKLNWESNYFDLVVSFNTLHNLYNYDLFKSLKVRS